MIDRGMTAAALLRAQTHVYNVCQDGMNVELIKPATSTAKDEFGTIVTSSHLDLKTFPVRFAPFSADVIQKITWVENVDILCYVSKLAVDNLSVTLKQLKKKYSHIRYDNVLYERRYIEYYNAFANDWLYVIIGGSK